MYVLQQVELREMISRGQIGKVTQVQVNYRHPIDVANGKAGKLRRCLMGDAVGMGINHAILAILFAMAPQAAPSSVFATSMPAQIRGFESEPIWNIQVLFDNGAYGYVFGNIDSGNGYDAYHSVSGTKGALIFDSLLDWPQKVRLWREGLADGRWVYTLDPERCRPDGTDLWREDTTTPDSGDVVEHQTSACVAHFIESIRGDRQSPLSFVNSATVAEVGWAAQVSAWQGQPILLPLDQRLVHRLLTPEAQIKSPCFCVCVCV